MDIMYPSHSASIPVNITHIPSRSGPLPSAASPSGSPSTHPPHMMKQPLSHHHHHTQPQGVSGGVYSSSPSTHSNSPSHSPKVVVTNGSAGAEVVQPTQPPHPQRPQQHPPHPPGPSPPGGMQMHNPLAINMNEQMRRMEADMQRMQHQMQKTFGTFPGMHPPLPMLQPPGLQPPGMQPPGMMSPFPQLPQNDSPRGTPPGGSVSITTQSSDSSSSHGTPPLTNPPAQPPGFLSPLPAGVEMNRALTPPPMDMRPHTPDMASGSPAPSFHSGDMMSMGRDGKKQLKLQFNMQDFNPDDVQVKTNKNRLEVSAHHEEKEPNRVSCRVFHQQYELPQDVRLAKTQYNMTPDGVLDVESKVKPNYRVNFAPENNTVKTYVPNNQLH